MQLKNYLSLLKRSPHTPFLIIGIIIFLTNLNLFQSYFQGDDWYFNRILIPFSHNPLEIIKGTYLSTFGGLLSTHHLTPLEMMLWLTLLAIFKLNYFPYILISLLWHIFNTILLGLTIKRLLPKQSIIAYAVALFFGLSFSNHEGYAWPLAFVFVVPMVTACLVAINTLINYVHKPAKRHLFWLVIWLSTAVLFKETGIMLTPVLLLFCWYHRQKLSIALPLTITAFTAIYIIFRILAPLMIDYEGNYNSQPYSLGSPQLITYRVITYPIKALIQPYAPIIPIRWLAEEITPLAYPHYGTEKEVRGINFLTFTQTAGIDLILFPIGSIMILILGILIYYYRLQKPHQQLLIMGIILATGTTLPLLAIASSVPWAAYVSFIDSRNLYLTNIGNAIIFALLINFLGNLFRRQGSQIFQSLTEYIPEIKLLPLIKKIPVTQSGFVLITTLVLIVWSCLNIYFIQLELNRLASYGKPQTTIINHILSKLPVLPKNAIIYIDSNQAYYGFAELMPPFQMHFGQIMAIIYYSKGQLPIQLLDLSPITKQGITGQGVVSWNGRSFGYYLSTQKLLDDYLDQQLPIDQIYSFKWDDKTGTVTDNTYTIRYRLFAFQQHLNKYSSWIWHQYPSQKLRLKLPPNTEITKSESPFILNLDTAKSKLQIKVLPKLNGPGIDTNLIDKTDSEGQLIGSNKTYRTIKMYNNETLTAVITTTGKSIKYFFPSNTNPDDLLELTVINHPYQPNNFPTEAEDIISFIQFPYLLTTIQK